MHLAPSLRGSAVQLFRKYLQRAVDHGRAASTVGVLNQTNSDPKVGAILSPTCNLTLEQRTKYERDGFFVVRGLYSLTKIEEFRSHFQKICCGEVDHGAMLVTRDAKERMDTSTGERAITKIKHFQDDPVLFKYCQDSAALEYVTSFTGPNVKAVHTMLINKPPDPGSMSSQLRLYQSLHYFPFRPADKIVCSWTAMERADRENGCLVVIPGSHKQPVLAHGSSGQDAAPGVHDKIWMSGCSVWQQSSSERRWRVHLVMEAGDTVFFHPLLIHGSGSNRTKRDHFRQSMACYYASADCDVIDVAGTIEADLTAEFVLGKRKASREAEAASKEMWREKSRMVVGGDA